MIKFLSFSHKKWYALRKKLAYKYYYLLDPFYKIVPQQSNPHIYLLFSEARSGTTWLAALLSEGLDAIISWEPLHPIRGLVSSKYGRRPYFTDFNKQELNQKLQKIVQGKGVNSWTSRMHANPIPFYTASKPLLIKFTRINRLLPELFEHLSFKHQPILLVRHPAAVFLSQYATFGDSQRGFYWTEQKKSEVLSDPRYKVHKNFIDHLDKLIYREFAVYCMNNYHIYNEEIESDKYILIFYEDLLTHPIETLKEVIKKWELDQDKIKKKLENTSNSDNSTSLKTKPTHQRTKWKDNLSEDEKKAFQGVLNYFGIHVYSMSAVNPIRNIKQEKANSI